METTCPLGAGTSRNYGGYMDMMEESKAKNKAILEALVKMAFRNSDAKEDKPAGPVGG